MDKEEKKIVNDTAEVKEEISDEEIMDIEKAEDQIKEEKKEESATQKANLLKKGPKSTEDFIKKQKKRKRTKRFIILCIVILAIVGIVLYVRLSAKKVKQALEQMQQNSYETATVEKKKLYESTNATGTLYAIEARTISTILQQSGAGAKIEKVNIEVGDFVHAGDVLVEFSTENIEKSINQKQEDLSLQKQQDALEAEDAQRNYVYSYSSAANSLRKASQEVDEALFNLHEACDGYGDAKREYEEIKNMSFEDYEKKYKYDKGLTDEDMKRYTDEYIDAERRAAIETKEKALTTAFDAQEKAQKAYDAAVEKQAQTISDTQSGGGGLSAADSNYKKTQLTAGKAVKDYSRQLEELNDSLEDYVVYATIDGIVTEVNVSEGNRFQSGNVATIQDISGYTADVLIDEYDIGKVRKAYKEAEENGGTLSVVVKTEATENKEFKGHVSSIAPTSTSTSSFSNSSSGSGASSGSSGSASSVNYKVTVELDEVDESFMVGMSAKVAIVVNESPEDALCVPYNAVEEKEDGRTFIRVIDEKGDKSVFGGPVGPDTEDDSASKVNGIVVEKNSSDKEKSGKIADNPISKKLGKKKDNEEADSSPKYREVEVEKIFETDYYAAIYPKNPNEVKEGDTVMIISSSADGMDMMMMFGGPGGVRR